MRSFRCIAFVPALIVAPGALAQCEPEWQLAFGEGVSGKVFGIAAFNDELVVGGKFVASGGLANNIARWDGTKWHPLSSGINGQVENLATFQGELYAGGSFSNAGGVKASNIARWNGSTWAPLGTGIEGVSSTVSTMHEHNAKLYVGGSFKSAGEVPVKLVAAWNGVAWQLVDTPFSGVPFGMASFEGDLYVCGLIGNSPELNAVVRYDGAAWSNDGHALPWGWTQPLPLSIAQGSGELFMGGYFLIPQQWPPLLYQRVDGQWLASDMPSFPMWPAPGAASFIAGVGTYQSRVVVASRHKVSSGPSNSGISQRVNGTWKPLTLSPMNGDAYALFEWHGDLIAGGTFTIVDGVPSPGVARYGCACYADCDNSKALDIDDFTCFQTLFAVGDPYTDCDSDGGLTMDDFVCFQSLYALGC